MLILDEPTSALGVREAEIVLRYISQARERGVGVVLITHNAHDAYAAGDNFTIVQRGRVSETFEKHELTPVEPDTAGASFPPQLAATIASAASALAHVVRVPQRVPPRLRPHAQAVPACSDRDTCKELAGVRRDHNHAGSIRASRH